MYALATCTASVIRGTTTNSFGDVVDSATVLASGIPASVIVKTRTVFDTATQTPRVVERITGVVGSGVDIRDTDQLRDDTHGITYAVQAVTQPNGPGLVPDLALELRRVK